MTISKNPNLKEAEYQRAILLIKAMFERFEAIITFQSKMRVGLLITRKSWPYNLCNDFCRSASRMSLQTQAQRTSTEMVQKLRRGPILNAPRYGAAPRLHVKPTRREKG
ncbi:hypothetical protein N7G274_009522 [Stereocaulon virgatum]|uniref:Gag-pol polyprotein n=1 Tax=Stereocaulon virgatum TaxID=373712 RepID=A0ABR3ZW11_9LECA